MEALRHSVFDIHAHLVLVTKYRRKAITEAMLARLGEFFAATCEGWGCRLEEFGGEADHVHLLLALNPTVQPSKLINNLKTVSSRRVRQEFPEQVRRFYRRPVFWSRTYCFVSCGGAPLDIIKRYLQEQDSPGRDSPPPKHRG